MNQNEKRIVLLILFLFAAGFAARYAPWSLPEIGETPVEYRLNNDAENLKMQALVEVKEKTGEVNSELAQTEKSISKKSKKRVSKKKVQFPIAFNSASLDELCALPGVGPKLAEKIISHRTRVGTVKNEADLLKIPGIGKKKAKNILKNIIFD